MGQADAEVGPYEKEWAMTFWINSRLSIKYCYIFLVSKYFSICSKILLFPISAIYLLSNEASRSISNAEPSLKIKM